MTVYIEYVLIDNLVINSMLLWFVYRTVKEKPKKLRIFISAAIGAAFSLVSPLMTVTGILALAIKLFMGAFMVFIISNKTFAKWFISYILFLTFTFVFGGVMYGTFNMLNTPTNSYLVSGIPTGLIVLACLVWAKIVSMLVRYINARKALSTYLREIIITYGGKQFKLTSFIDSGNRLCDPDTNMPVVVISLNAFLKMFPDTELTQVFLNRLNIEGGKYISYNTVQSGGAKMFVFKPEKLEIIGSHTTTSEVCLGLTTKAFKDAVKYEALLNPALVA